MPKEEIRTLQALGGEAAHEGPPILLKLDDIRKKYPKSLYAQFVYFQTLYFFKFETEITKLAEILEKQFPDEVLVNCIKADLYLKERQFDLFLDCFSHAEALKGSFPKRRIFFFEEALFFHLLWGKYHAEKGDFFQHQKHVDFLQLLSKTYHLK